MLFVATLKMTAHLDREGPRCSLAFVPVLASFACGESWWKFD